MSTPIQPGDRPVAITVTWVTTAVHPDDLAARLRQDPITALNAIDFADRWPVSVSVRPAHDLDWATTQASVQPDTAEAEQPADRPPPPPPDLFFGPELAGETLRRIAEADRYHQRAMRLADEPVTTSYDGDPSECAEHMRVTALALATLADVAARLGPGWDQGRAEGADEAWSAALSGVLALIPPPAAEEQVDEALVAAVEAGGAAAWEQHHGKASYRDETTGLVSGGLVAACSHCGSLDHEMHPRQPETEAGDGAR